MRSWASTRRSRSVFSIFIAETFLWLQFCKALCNAAFCRTTYFKWGSASAFRSLAIPTSSAADRKALKRLRPPCVSGIFHLHLSRVAISKPDAAEPRSRSADWTIRVIGPASLGCRHVAESLVEPTHVGMSQKFAARYLVTRTGEQRFKISKMLLSSVRRTCQARLSINDHGREIQVICCWTIVGFLADFHLSGFNRTSG